MNWRRLAGFPETSTTPDELAAETAASPSTERRSLGNIPLHEEDTRERWGRRALRTLLIAATAVLLFVGIRTLINPYPQAEPYVTPPALGYDRTAAQAVAARWADAYLTLDKADTGGAVRAQSLALDAARGVDTSGGVAITQPQAVETIVPGQVEVGEDGTSSIVTVLARVHSGENGTPRWVALAVPVGTDGVRPVVTAPGAYIALPSPGEARSGSAATGDEDSALSAATRPHAAAWFSAYGADRADALDAISAPGSSVGPVGGLELKSLDAWRVYAGDSQRRNATANVTWTTPSGDVRQSYNLTISAVRSGDTTDWRVLTATASSTR